MKEIKPEPQVCTYLQYKEDHEPYMETLGVPSSSRWEETISDTQAVTLSDYLLTEQEAETFLEEEVLQEHLEVGENRNTLEATSGQPDNQAPSNEDIAEAPSWEVDRSQPLLPPRPVGP